MKFHMALALVLVVTCAVACAQQNGPSVNPSSLTREEVHAVNAQLRDLLTQHYFDMAAIPRIVQALNASEARGDYAGAANAADLASRLNKTIATAVQDKHLLVLVDGPESPTRATSSLQRAERSRLENYGLKRVEILPGNVGYLEITAFYRANEGGESLQSAMEFVRHADAILLDLRKNAGGSPDTAIQLLSSFFDTPDLPLLSVMPRDGEPIRYTRVLRNVTYSNETRPVYVLVSSSTWSAGEAVAFILQERHRATVVGERTSGAANPASSWPVGKDLSVNIPYGHIETAVRKTNWETQGVQPDLEIAPERAEQAAYREALSKLLAGASDPARKKWLADAMAAAKRVSK